MSDKKKFNSDEAQDLQIPTSLVGHGFKRFGGARRGQAAKVGFDTVGSTARDTETTQQQHRSFVSLYDDLVQGPSFLACLH